MPPVLMAVNRVIGGVEVEDQVLGRLEMGSDELIDQDLGAAHQARSVDAVFQTAEGGGRSELRLLLGSLAHSDLEGGVGAEGLMVVEVLIAGGEGEDPLSEHGLLVVDDGG